MDRDRALPWTLRPSKLKLLGYLAVSAGFTAGGVSTVSTDPLVGYGTAGFFGLGTLIFALQFLPGCTRLRLTQDGFTYSGLFRSHTVRWRDVEWFSVVRAGHNDMVGWNFVSDYQAHPRGRAMSRRWTGLEGALPNTYGMKAQELVVLMNRLRARYGAGEPVA